MKRSYIKKIGKIGLINLEVNRKIKEMFLEKGIDKCEIRLPGCMITWPLAPAHRHKRVWYYSQPELLSDFSQFVLACQRCHEKIENDKDLTEKVFKRLRK
jgi:hypothetical protein